MSDNPFEYTTPPLKVIREMVAVPRAKYDALMALMAAAKEVLSMSDDFCAGMGPAWEGDPLTDACDKLRAALRAAGIQTEEP